MRSWTHVLLKGNGVELLCVATGANSEFILLLTFIVYFFIVKARLDFFGSMGHKNLYQNVRDIYKEEMNLL